MIRILQIDETGNLHTPASLPDTWQASIMNHGEIIWIDINGDEEVGMIEQFLARHFGFHPLAIDDALHETHIPKIDDWGSYLYLALQDLIYNPAEQTVSMIELDLFLGHHFLVTYHEAAVTAVDRVWHIYQRNSHWRQHGPDHLLYRLLDEITNNYTTILEQLESDIIQLESQIFAGPSAPLLESLTSQKRMVLQIRRALAPQREVTNKLARDAYEIIDSKDQIYFRDVYDHLVRLYDLSDSVRDLLTGSMEIYLSVVNNRMNDIMKTLTIITTLFMPLTFITGFFGMNFFQAVLPSQTWTGPGMLGLALASILLLPLIMFLWMRQHDWM